MIRAVLLSSAVLTLSACSDAKQIADQTGRKAATSAVTEIIAIHFSQVPKPLIETFTSCVIENASAVEVRELAKASFVGIDDDTVAVVRNGLARPTTQNCLRERALTAL